MWYSQGELGRARTALTRGLALADGAGDMAMVVQAHNLFGHMEHAVGDINAARDRFTYSIDGFRALEIPWGTGNALIGNADWDCCMQIIDFADRSTLSTGTPRSPVCNLQVCNLQSPISNLQSEI